MKSKRAISGTGRLENIWSRHLTLRGAERAARRWTKAQKYERGTIVKSFTEPVTKVQPLRAELMPDLPIPAEAIEAAAKAFEPEYGKYSPLLQEEALRDAEAALRAAFDALGTEVERQAAQEGMEEAPARERLVARWFPVKP